LDREASALEGDVASWPQAVKAPWVPFISEDSSKHLAASKHNVHIS
jgi:hypothetical protein